MIEITSKNNQKIKDAASLRVKKYRQEKGLFLMEGLKNLEMALRFGKVKEIYTCIGLPKLKKPDIEVYKVNDEIIRKLAYSENPEGVVFVCEYVKPLKTRDSYNKIIYLDHISDPGNLGTIIRTAVAFNYDAVILSEGSVDLYNEKVLAATKGAIFAIDILTDDIRNYDVPIIVSTLNDKSEPLHKFGKLSEFILVLGNESHGVSKEICDIADQFVKIEMSDNIDSLNVAVAAGILMNYFK